MMIAIENEKEKEERIEMENGLQVSQSIGPPPSI